MTYQLTKIECAEVNGDHMTFAFEPNAQDGKPAGLEMTKSGDGTVTMNMESLIKLRDAINEAIEANQ